MRALGGIVVVVALVMIIASAAAAMNTPDGPKKVYVYNVRIARSSRLRTTVRLPPSV